VSGIPKPKRERRARTDAGQQVTPVTLWPEQEAYELMRPLVLSYHQQWHARKGST
jgi:hypothetical protein